MTELVIVFLLAGAGLAVASVRRSGRADSIQQYERALQRLRDMPARVGAAESRTPASRPAGTAGGEPPASSPSRAVAGGPGPGGARDPLTRLRMLEVPAGSGVPQKGAAPWLLEEAASVVGVFDERRQRAPGVEANARLTATTGLVLIMLFFVEGLTLPVISRFLSWHIAIGLALIPPVLLKMGSTLWRFAHYYLGDRRYQRAGPPHPLLRVLGPLVMASTVALIASGVALWLAGPRDVLWLRLHQVTFVLWFAAVAVHVLSHAWRATRLAAADSRDLRRRRSRVPGVRARRIAVALSLALGSAIGLIGVTVTTGWSHLTLRPPSASTAAHPGWHNSPAGGGGQRAG